MKRTESSVKKSCDKLMSVLIRSRGRCENCGTRDNLQWCHIKSRRYLSIRWNINNSLCLCSGCHRWFSDHPDLFTKWIDKNWPGRLDELNREFQKIFKMTLDDRLLIEQKLKDEKAKKL